MPLTKVEHQQLKTAFMKLNAFNIAGHGHMVALHHILELINFYTEETIEAIKAGKHEVKYIEGIPNEDELSNL